MPQQVELDGKLLWVPGGIQVSVLGGMEQDNKEQGQGDKEQELGGKEQGGEASSQEHRDELHLHI